MIVTNEDLKHTDFVVHKTYEPSRLTIDDYKKNPFGLLTNYENYKLKFIKFPDQKVIIRNQKGKELTVFGSCFDGFFTIDDSGAIWLFTVDNPLFVEDIVYVNSSLENFVDCYCLLISVVFRLKFNKSTNTEQIILKLDKVIVETDATTKNDIFWDYFLDLIENHSFPLVINFSEYMEQNIKYDL